MSVWVGVGGGAGSPCPEDWMGLLLRNAAVTHSLWALLGEHQLPLFCPTGGCAHGKLFPGDQILQVNNELAEELSYEQVVDILRYEIVFCHPEAHRLSPSRDG